MTRHIRTIYILTLLPILLLVIGVFSISIPAPAAANSNGCPIVIEEPADIMSLAYNDQIEFSTFSVDPTNNASITVTNNTDCDFPVSLGAYKVEGNGHENQELFSSSTPTVIEPHSNQTVFTSLPNCTAQIDLLFDKDLSGLPEVPKPANANLIGFTFQLRSSDDPAKHDIPEENDIFHFEEGHPYEELDNFPNDKDEGFDNMPQENLCDENTPLQAQCSVSPDPAETGETVTWSAVNVSGGDGEYSYTWTGDATGNSREVEKEYTTTGEKEAQVKVESGGQQLKPECSMQVEDDVSDDESLDVNCQVTPSTASTSEQVEWSVDSVTGGSGNYSYSWSGDVSGNTESVTKSYTATGTKQATVEVEDNENNKEGDAQCQMNVSDGGGGGGGDFNLSITDPFSWLVSNSPLRSTKAALDLSALNGFNGDVTLTAASGMAIDNNDTEFIHNGGSPQNTVTLDPSDFSDPLTVHVRDSIDAGTYPLTVSAKASGQPTTTKPVTLYVRSLMEF